MDSSIFECFSGSERSSKAISRIQNKLYDADSWNMLIKDAQSKSIDSVELFYEELVRIFPTCGRYWRSYIEHEMREKRYDKVSKLFQRCLEEVLSIDLYKCYLNYVREVKANEPDLIYKAYLFTLDKVGIDPNAIGIYNDYIQFLHERTVDSSYLESQKIHAVRRAYQEGVLNPMFHIATLWEQYITFEKNNHSNIAKKMDQDLGRGHMTARNVAKEWEVTIRGLTRTWPASPPSFSPEEQRQIEIWRRYVQWEKSNPLKTENNQVITKRISYAYKQYLLCFGHHPNVWYEYYTFLEEQIRLLGEKETDLKQRLLKDMVTLFERATHGLMKHNLLIHFAYADFEENRKDTKKASDIYNKLIEAGRDEANDDKIDLTLVYIQWMRFTRRTEGLKAARAVFKRAREEKRVAHQIYTAAALMEYHCTKDQAIACKIFELGIKKFGACSDFILSYIHFMNTLNEENNTRVLFERVLTTTSLQPTQTVEIWNAFLEFEAGIGDLSSITKVERRRTQALEKAFPRCSDASWSVDKYKFQDLYPCSLSELKSLGYDARQTITSLASVRDMMISLSAPADGLLGASQPLTSASGGGGNANSGNSGNNSSSSNNSANNSHSNGTKNLKLAPASRQMIGKSLNGGGGQMGDLYEQADVGEDFGGGGGGGLSGPGGQQGANWCMPDLDQMLPFKPVVAQVLGNHTVPGGVFPPPPALGMLLTKLPQSGAFWGPFVDVDELCNIVRSSDFDELLNNLVEQRRSESAATANSGGSGGGNKPRVKKARLE